MPASTSHGARPSHHSGGKLKKHDPMNTRTALHVLDVARAAADHQRFGACTTAMRRVSKNNQRLSHFGAPLYADILFTIESARRRAIGAFEAIGLLPTSPSRSQAPEQLLGQKPVKWHQLRCRRRPCQRARASSFVYLARTLL